MFLTWIIVMVQLVTTFSLPKELITILMIQILSSPNAKNYEINDWRTKAYLQFEKDYSDLDNEIFKYYKKRYIKYPNFIFIKPTDDLNSFLKNILILKI